MGVKRIKTETLEMREMFEYYYALGDQRSFQKVADKFGRSMTSIKRYALSFNWTERVEQRDLANAEELEKRTNEAVVNSKARYRELIKKLTDEFARDVDNGKIKIRSTKAFVELVNLDLQLMGVDSESELVDNVSSLVEALKGSGFDDVPDPDEEE